MGIEIVNQTNEQECGVCALMSLHNHFYKENIGKEQVLEQSHISEGGMTIFDLEALGKQLGLECESYEVKYSEFLNLKINNYFILLLATGNGSTNHYVVARKQKTYIEIYDSCSSDVNKISYKQLEKMFLNVIVLVKKQPNKAFNKVFGKASTLLMFDLKFVLLNLGLSILILTCSIGTASFLNFIIDLVINKSSINNLITICFIFILIYFSNDLLTYVSNLYMSRHIKNYFVLFTNKILSSLETKKPDFLFKVDKNWIFKADECVYNIANFCVLEINKFITSIIFTITCICVIGSLQYYLLIFVFAYLVVQFIFFLFSYRKKKEVFISVVRNENNNANHYKNLIFSLNNEMWLTKRQNIITKIKTNYSNIYKNYYDTILFKSNTDLFKSILKSFCDICVIALMAVLIIKTNKLSIGKLTFVISAFALFKNSTTDLFGYFLSRVEFDIYWQVYKDLTQVSNVNHKTKFVLQEKIKTISFKNEDHQITLLNNEKQQIINCRFINLLRNNKQILINGKEQEVSKEFIDSIIIFDQQSKPNNQLLISNIENNPIEYGQYLQYFNLDLNETNPSFYHSLIINLLTLLNEKEKLIFIDDVIACIKPKDKLVVKQLINKIRKNNTVFVLGKEEND